VKITISTDFINWRTDKAKLYNPRGRTEQKFLMDIDCEVIEWAYLSNYNWTEHPSWMVDGINHVGNRIDVKVIQKWYNITEGKILNILQQRNIVDAYSFWELKRPRRPLTEGDVVEAHHIRDVDYGSVADGIRPSKNFGFYFDARNVAGCCGGTLPTKYPDVRWLQPNMGESS